MLHWDLCALIVHHSGLREPSVDFRQSYRRWAIVVDIHTVGYPLVVTATVCVIFALLGSQGAHPTVQAIEALHDRLLALPWTGAVDFAQLATLAPLADEIARGVANFLFWQRLGFAFFMGVAICLWLVRRSVATALTGQVWIPMVALHLRSLARQIKILRATAEALLVSRGAVGTTLGSITAGADTTERRTRFLIRVCITRAAIAICAYALITIELITQPSRSPSPSSRPASCCSSSIRWPSRSAKPATPLFASARFSHLCSVRRRARRSH